MDILKLHPSINILELGGTNIQIRVPDGEHLSFDTRGLSLDPLFSLLKNGATLDQALSLFDEKEKNKIAHLIGGLQNRGYITNNGDYFGSSDYLLNVLDYYVQSAVRMGGNEAELKRKSVYVTGHGLIANTARSTLKKIGLLSDSRDEADLVMVGSDGSDFDMLLEENRKAIEDGQRVTFVYRVDSRLVIGPIVYPKESACFNCFTERLRSNTYFINEFESLVSQEVEADLTDENQVLSGLLQFYICHHAVFALFELFEGAAPGEVFEFGLTTGTTKKSPVLKLPRCGTCGRGKQGEINRAVRDLL